MTRSAFDLTAQMQVFIWYRDCCLKKRSTVCLGYEEDKFKDDFFWSYAVKHIRYIVGATIVISIVVIVVLFREFGIDYVKNTVTKTGADFIKEIFKTVLSVCLVGGFYFIYQSLVEEDREKKAKEQEVNERRQKEIEQKQDEKREREEIESELRQKHRDLDSQLRREFINNYGRFRTNVRTWKVYRPVPKKFHELLPAVIEDEGKLEALIVEAASRRTMEKEQACLLGLFRQGYQTLRQHLDDDRKPEPPHNYSNDDYHLFTMLFAALANLLVEERDTRGMVDIQFNIDRIYECRSDNWDAAIMDFGESGNVSDVLKKCAERNEKARYSAGMRGM